MILEKIAFDQSFIEQYKKPILGIDEVGLGCLAGPIVVCAVAVDSYQGINCRVNDSKKLTQVMREDIVANLSNLSYCLGIVEAYELNEIGLSQGHMLAVKRALSGFDINQYTLLMDGIRGLANMHMIKKGDQKSCTIGLASIIAKVSRDRIMQVLHEEHPQYKWDANKGYGTAAHLAGLANHGVTEYHRTFYKPVSGYV